MLVCVKKFFTSLRFPLDDGGRWTTTILGDDVRGTTTRLGLVGLSRSGSVIRLLGEHDCCMTLLLLKLMLFSFILGVIFILGSCLCGENGLSISSTVVDAFL